MASMPCVCPQCPESWCSRDRSHLAGSTLTCDGCRLYAALQVQLPHTGEPAAIRIGIHR